MSIINTCWIPVRFGVLYHAVPDNWHRVTVISLRHFLDYFGFKLYINSFHITDFEKKKKSSLQLVANFLAPFPANSSEGCICHSAQFIPTRSLVFTLISLPECYYQDHKKHLTKIKAFSFLSLSRGFVSVLVLVFNLGWPPFPFFSKFPGSPHVLWEFHLTSLGVSYHLLFALPLPASFYLFQSPRACSCILIFSLPTFIIDYFYWWLYPALWLQPWISKCLLKFPLGYLKKYETSHGPNITTESCYKIYPS